LGYISVAESLCISLTTFTQCVLEATLQNSVKEHKIKAITPFKVIQGHWFLVPIESTFTISYWWLTLTYLLSCTISEI